MKIKLNSPVKIFNVYLIIFLMVLAANFFLNESPYSHIFKITIVVFSFLPFLFVVYHNQQKVLFLQLFTFYLLFSFFILLVFRNIRNTFPIPEVNEEKIVGYAQYFSYPLYFDTFLFLLLLMFPVVIFIILHKKNLQ